MKRKKAVLVGFSGHGRQWLNYRDMIEITAVSAPPEARNFPAMAEYKGRIYEDAAEMLEKEDADCALIWSPGSALHVPLGLKALERGMHVLMEKPLSEDMEQAVGFVAAAKTAGRVAMIMQDVRWQNSAMEVKEALDQGAIGRMYWFENGFRGDYGSFIYEGIHMVDLARYWAGREAEWVSAAAVSPQHRPITHDNIIEMRIGFADNLSARVFMDWSCLGHSHWIKARLQGDKAVMEVVWSRPIRVQSGKDPVRELPRWTVEDNALGKLLRHFLECVETGKEPVNSAADHLKTLDIVFAARESARERRTVALPYLIPIM